MHEVLVNRLGGLNLPRKSVVRLTDRPDLTLDVYRGRKTPMQQQQQINKQYIAHRLDRVSLVFTSLLLVNFRDKCKTIDIYINAILKG